MQQSIVVVTYPELPRRLPTLEFSFRDLSLQLSLHNIPWLEFLVQPGFNKPFDRSIRSACYEQEERYQLQ